LCQVEFHVANLNAPIFGVVQDLVVEMGIVEERFRRNAANVQACPSKRAAFFDAGNLITTVR
jgi:hypothetical protein